ncbi:MAG TPA: hypothetical protein ENG00_01430 [Candidatus Aenigmarchaeota archaeon]|nr:hypothetical protein [Candidatus Aenigmarchaeota archaeon]
MGFYKRLSVKLFGWLAGRTLSNFKSLEPQIRGAGMNILLKVWVSIIYLSVFLAYTLSLVSVFIANMFFEFETTEFVYYAIFIPILVASFTFVILYVYPAQKAKSVKKSIDNNLPFALIHMEAVTSSGIPPEFMFELISRFKEYGKLSEQMGLVVRNIKTFGMSSVSAVYDVAKRTPSKELRQILNGIGSTIERGGDLSRYLKEMSEKTLFDYRMKREKYSKTLSALSDIYTALLITGPLMIISVIVMMNIIGGDIFGLGIAPAIFVMILIITMANIVYLVFLEISCPG